MAGKVKLKRGTLTLPHQGPADVDEPISEDISVQKAMTAHLGDDGELIYDEEEDEDESMESGSKGVI